jgi:hypothetical protein
MAVAILVVAVVAIGAAFAIPLVTRVARSLPQTQTQSAVPQSPSSQSPPSAGTPSFAQVEQALTNATPTSP